MYYFIFISVGCGDLDDECSSTLTPIWDENVRTSNYCNVSSALNLFSVLFQPDLATQMCDTSEMQTRCRKSCRICSEDWMCSHILQPGKNIIAFLLLCFTLHILFINCSIYCKIDSCRNEFWCFFLLKEIWQHYLFI